jgi:ribose-phosphate pyrophosphokinase
MTQDPLHKAIFINGKAVEITKFPGGEVHVRLPLELCDTPNEWIEVTAIARNSDVVMALLLTMDSLRRTWSHASYHLVIPYFPYGRQDRVCSPGEALSVKVMADLINSMGFDIVYTFVPHSHVTTALINNCRPSSLSAIMLSHREKGYIDKLRQQKPVLVSPDAGAEKSVLGLAKEIHQDDKEWEPEVVCAYKNRDVDTGNITEVGFHGDVKGKDLLIIDDICDGGRTFIELSKALKTAGARNIDLFVVHGIFSNGFQELKKHCRTITCEHTLNHLSPEGVVAINGIV